MGRSGDCKRNILWEWPKISVSKFDDSIIHYFVVFVWFMVLDQQELTHNQSVRTI